MPLALRALRSCAAARMLPMFSNTLARSGSRLSKAPACTRHSSALLVDDLRIDAMREIGEVGERLVAAHRDEVLDRLRADALQRGERVDDPPAERLEGDARAVDVGRHDLDAEPPRLQAEFVELVGVAHVERHRRREELDRVVRLQIGRLVGDQRIGAPSATC